MQSFFEKGDLKFVTGKATCHSCETSTAIHKFVTPLLPPDFGVSSVERLPNPAAI